MARVGSRRQRGGGLDAWPGYVDALSTLLMVIIFVLLVFVLAQGFLSVALSSRDRALDRLNRQVAELAEMLALERGQAGELRNALSRTAEELRSAATTRDALAAQLRETREERDQLGADRDAVRAERDRLTARLTDLDLAGRGSAERMAALESQLAEALRRAEAAGGDAAQTVRRLTETGRNLAAERAARAQAEAQLAESRGAVETARRELEGVNRLLAEAQARLTETQRQLAAMRAEVAALDRQVQADRATIETRLSDIARLSEQIRALSAMRDQMERQAAEAARRAGDEAQRRSTAEATAGTEAERRAAAERTAAAESERRRAAETIANEEAQRRQAAERAVGEQTRLAESARAQVALLTRQIEELRAQIARVAAALDIAEASGRDKDAQISALGTRLNAALAARVEELQRYRSDFFGRLRDVLGDRPEVRIVGDRFVFQSEVLFPPGSADLSAAGQSQIREIARVLQELSARIPRDVNWLLRVDGHADRTPIRSARFASNWELSAARAIAVAQLLMAEGLPPNRVAATAFGDNQPLDPGDSPEALARNRRIELRLTDR